MLAMQGSGKAWAQCFFSSCPEKKCKAILYWWLLHDVDLQARKTSRLDFHLQRPQTEIRNDKREGGISGQLLMLPSENWQWPLPRLFRYFARKHSLIAPEHPQAKIFAYNYYSHSARIQVNNQGCCIAYISPCFQFLTLCCFKSWLCVSFFNKSKDFNLKPL